MKSTKKILCMILLCTMALALVLPAAANAEGVASWEGMEWEFDPIIGALFIEASGALPAEESLPWLGKAASMEAFCVSSGVTEIPAGYTAGFVNMRTVMIPGTLAKVGDGVFYVSDSIQRVYYEGTLEQLKKIDMTPEDLAALLKGEFIESEIKVNSDGSFEYVPVEGKSGGYSESVIITPDPETGGYIKTWTDVNGNTHTEYYNKKGYLYRETITAENGQVIYDETYNSTVQSNIDGSRDVIYFDPQSGDWLRVTHYDSNGKAVSDKFYYEDHLTEFQYDADGNTSYATSTYYDKNGKKTEVIEAWYDANQNVIRGILTEYDADGNVTSTYEKEYEYNNPDGKKSKTTGTLTDGNGVVTSTLVAEYAADGETKINETETEFENGKPSKETRTEYDADGNVTSTYEKEYEYNNPDGKLSKTTATLTNDSGVETTVTEYAADGETKIKETVTEYDADGETKIKETVTECDADGKTKITETVFKYDADGKLTEETDSEFEYDADGNLIAEGRSVYDGDGYLLEATMTEYDADGMITLFAEAERDENGDIIETVTEYGPNENVITESTVKYDSDGFVIEGTMREYDADGNLVRYGEAARNASGNYDETITEVDAEGNPTKVTQSEYASDGETLIKQTETTAESTTTTEYQDGKPAEKTVLYNDGYALPGSDGKVVKVVTTYLPDGNTRTDYYNANGELTTPAGSPLPPT